MTFKKLGVLLSGAVGLALLFSGCSGMGGLDGGMTGPCTSTSCMTGEFCHPTAKVCVSNCTAGADCPATAQTCSAFPDGGGGGQKFCQCSTSQLCNGSSTGSLICSDEDKICRSKCSSDADCQGRKCDVASGQCRVTLATDGGTDGGTDAGTGCTPTCTGGQVCSGTTCVDPCFPGYCATASDNCNWTSGLCVAPFPCTSGGQQPEACYYGEFCAATGDVCKDVPASTCANFTPGTGKTPVWDPRTDTGPIIWKIDSDPSAPTANCFKGFYVHSMFLNAYAKDTDFPTQLTALGGIFYVTTTGAYSDLTAGLPGSYYVRNSTNLKQMRLRVYLCAQTASSFSAGFYMSGGNEICTDTGGGTAGTTSCTSNSQCAPLTCNTGTGTCG